MRDEDRSQNSEDGRQREYPISNKEFRMSKVGILRPFGAAFSLAQDKFLFFSVRFSEKIIGFWPIV